MAKHENDNQRSAEHPHTLLLVDDDAIFRDRLARSFRDRGYEVQVAGGFDVAIDLAQEESPELAVVDLKMPGRSGLDLVRALKDVDAATRVIVLTGYGSIATAVEAMRRGAENYLPKPADADDIIAAFVPDHDSADDPVEVDRTAPTLARAEWEHVHRVLADCDGNISEAARRLGIHRRSLQRKLQKYAPRERARGQRHEALDV